MRRSRQDAAATRERIVEAASREFRLNGIAEGLEDIMKTAGLTHGGFYKHFESKSQLISEAVALAFDQLVDGLETALASIVSNICPQQCETTLNLHVPCLPSEPSCAQPVRKRATSFPRAFSG